MSAVAIQSRLTSELIEAVAESLRVNPNWRAAADHAGINERTLRAYRERGERYETHRNGATEVAAGDDHPDFPYWEAVQQWTEARAGGERELVNLCFQAAQNGNTQMMQWLLKVGWPDRYNERLIVSGPDGGPIELSVDERREALVAKVREHQARCAKKPPAGKTRPRRPSA